MRFTSSFDQLKIYKFYREIKKKKTKKSSFKTVNHHKEEIYTSFKLSVYRGGPVDRGVKLLVLTDSEGPGSKGLEAKFS